jgi:hypothetical protein
LRLNGRTPLARLGSVAAVTTAVAIGALLFPALDGASRAFGVAPASSGTPAAASSVLWAEHFSGSVDWADPENHRPAELNRIYAIMREGAFGFLHARHDCTAPSPPKAMHYGKGFPDHAIPLEKVSSLRWRWRAKVQPSVTDDPWLDMAASIYVVMKTPSLFSKGRGFKFGWLAKPGPTGTFQRGILQVPLRSDPPSDKWSAESVNLCDLYRRTFGACEGEQVLYVGVTTDADGTHSIAEGDYADFELRGTP